MASVTSSDGRSLRDAEVPLSMPMVPLTGYYRSLREVGEAVTVDAMKAMVRPESDLENNICGKRYEKVVDSLAMGER